jgi:YD repeat-containing protein
MRINQFTPRVTFFTHINRDDQDSNYNYSDWHANCTQPAQPMPHDVKQIGSDYYCYDGNGNMTARNDESGSYEQEFDVENRLVAVTDTVNSEVTRFYYDASGQCLLTIEPDGITIYYSFPGYEEEVSLEGEYGLKD